METKLLDQHQQKLFRQRCNFCNGDHWNDECPSFSTVEQRKQLLKKLGCCYNCLKRGHIAFECYTKKTCFFCKRENHHHRSLCQLNVNCISLKRTNLSMVNSEELCLRQSDKMMHNTVSNEQTALSQHNKTEQVNDEQCHQALIELRQIKSDLEVSRNENATLKEKILKLETDQENLQTSLLRYCNTDLKQSFSEEIYQLKERIQKLEYMNNNCEINGNQKIGVDMKVKNENDGQSLSVTEHIQKSWLKFHHSNEEKEECSFLETERAYRKGKTFSTNKLSVDGGTGEGTERSQKQILKSIFSDPGMSHNVRTTSFEFNSKHEEILCALVKVLGSLMSK